MIDIEQSVLTLIKSSISEEVAEVYSEYTATPSEFPCVMVQEIVNKVFTDSQDSTSFENHCEISYQIDIFTVGPNKKFDAKRIANLIDEVLNKYNFTRTFCQRVSNAYDDKIYRFVARYDAIVGKDNYVYSIK